MNSASRNSPNSAFALTEGSMLLHPLQQANIAAAAHEVVSDDPPDLRAAPDHDRVRRAGGWVGAVGQGKIIQTRFVIVEIDDIRLQAQVGSQMQRRSHLRAHSRYRKERLNRAVRTDQRRAFCDLRDIAVELCDLDGCQ